MQHLGIGHQMAMPAEKNILSDKTTLWYTYIAVIREKAGNFFENRQDFSRAEMSLR